MSQRYYDYSTRQGIRENLFWLSAEACLTL